MANISTDRALRENFRISNWSRVSIFIFAGDLKTMLPIKVDIDARLKELINSAPIIIFMKGSPEVNIIY